MRPDICYKLYSYEDAISHSKIINTNQLDSHIWVELPHCISKHWNLCDITECGAKTQESHIEFNDSVFREYGRPWLRVETSILNISAGFHMYKLSFVDEVTADITSMYIAYHIQDDTPDTSSYVYMKRDEV